MIVSEIVRNYQNKQNGLISKRLEYLKKDIYNVCCESNTCEGNGRVIINYSKYVEYEDWIVSGYCRKCIKYLKKNKLYMHIKLLKSQ